MQLEVVVRHLLHFGRDWFGVDPVRVLCHTIFGFILPVVGE